MPVSSSPRPDALLMQRAPKRREDEVFGLIEQHLAGGDVESAMSALLPELDRRGGNGDQACALAARLLRARDGAAQTPDALATALDRLVRLVQRQDEQIRALRALVEEGL
jgi:hypothetical protein